MPPSMILHHYDDSPYAEKIRLMFGLTRMHWQSLRSSAWPPRPNLDPLVGGYRRIPVAQLGADLFCDTRLIAMEVARLTDQPAVDPSTVTGEPAALMDRAEHELFFAAISAVPPARLLTTMLMTFGPLGMARFVRDRAKLMRGGTVRPPSQAKSQHIMQSMLTAIESRLEAAPWITGEQPGVADFAVYHPLWLHVLCSRRPLDAGPRVQRWYRAVTEIGHGERSEIHRDQAFAAAADTAPRPLPAHSDLPEVEPGQTVQVAPADYGVVPVTGKLAAATQHRVIVQRDTPQFGAVHVHFPRAGYAVTAV